MWAPCRCCGQTRFFAQYEHLKHRGHERIHQRDEVRAPLEFSTADAIVLEHRPERPAPSRQ